MSEEFVQKEANSNAGRVFAALREDLLNGQYQAGEKLAIASLRDNYQVGLSPLREALSRLAAVGLLEQEAQRGFRVPKLCREELQDIVDLRVELEGMAISRALRYGDSTWESEVLAAGHRLKRADGEGVPLADWEHLHTQFHAVLLSSCQSAWMLKFIRQLHEQFDRYRRQAPRNLAMRKVLNAQHEDLVTLALARNEVEIRQLLERHIRLSHEVALPSCS
ncbi:GntR family transcriptional regulator [Marinobacter sp. X15-166B]|uniref:GntR family transcriptional regulator n=1 Tax=Marinobacter sp. X15-166B TaxID=1897620 RepID=UPI00085C9C47|nr:FCD domain-containing protein [Marinobacter sp. X15-166B]OEY66024.1 GntR family transcriptional regulator [Marinobacter sp. X15-166B]